MNSITTTAGAARRELSGFKGPLVGPGTATTTRLGRSTTRWSTSALR
jgi:hypothetical protein